MPAIIQRWILPWEQLFFVSQAVSANGLVWSSRLGSPEPWFLLVAVKMFSYNGFVITSCVPAPFVACRSAPWSVGLQCRHCPSEECVVMVRLRRWRWILGLRCYLELLCAIGEIIPQASSCDTLCWSTASCFVSWKSCEQGRAQLKLKQHSPGFW